MPSWIKAVFFALAGLLPALLAEIIAFGLAGAGHGWVAPLFYGLGLFLAWPATLAVLAVAGRGRRLACAVLLGAGLLADAALTVDTLANERRYFEQSFEIAANFTFLWILLWLGWQGIAFAALAADYFALDPEWE